MPALMKADWPKNTATLLELGERQQENWWTVNHAFQGVQVFGSTGSGKSSGSGAAIARAYMESNFGGLVLTAKTDERHEWEKLAAECGRTPDLIIFSEDEPHRFNFLRYELTREGKGAGSTENLVNLFWSVMEAAERKNRGGDAFWSRALKQLLRNSIDLLQIATGDIDLTTLYTIITSAPGSSQQAADEFWRDESICYRMLLKAGERAAEIGRKEDFDITYKYWMNDFAQLAIETKSGIVTMFSSMADGFLRGVLRKMFCTDLNFKPEETFDGKIIILDFSVKEYSELGMFAQILFKYVWQRAVERRIPAGISRADAEETIRPVFLWADESQFFINHYDSLFQSTARSSRACTVYLTQTLPGYEAAFQSEGGRPAAEAFLGNLQTKIFHANGDPATNNWASDSIGRARQIQISTGMSQGERHGSGQQNSGGAMHIEHVVQAQEFTGLRSGGDDYQGIVDAIIFQGGRLWVVEENGKQVTKNYLRHSFEQTQQ